jgi:hemerythrin-like domain-containing protein
LCCDNDEGVFRRYTEGYSDEYMRRHGMQAIETLKAEHDAVLAVLDTLERGVGAAAGGNPVPAVIFADIQEFFAIFVERCHTSKEEAEVFSRLDTDRDAAVVADLEREHRLGRDFAAAYAAAVREYVPGDLASAKRLEGAARQYAARLRAHIEHETRDLFPVIERVLAAQDSQLVDAFDRIEAEQIGDGTHERLHGMLDTLPARLAPWLEAPGTQR